MNYKNSILECIGNTPLIRLSKIEKRYNLSYKLFAKVERFNPSGSIKDRASFYMIKNALIEGIIDKDTLIIEPTSGNTGISLAMICAYYNLNLNIYMPSSCSKERVKMMEAFGAKVILTDANLGMNGAVEAAEYRHQIIKNSFIPSQFKNINNSLSHYEITSLEILSDLDNELDVLIAGIGTGGTLMGISRKIKNLGLSTEIIAVEPFSSPLVSQNIVSSHKIQGIGPNFIPDLIDKTLIDNYILVKDEDAFEMCNVLTKAEGIFAGISSGAALKAGLSLDNKKYENKNVVIILPDNGERYLSIENLYE